MDTLSHALWGKGLFGYRRYRWLPLLFGAVPDLLSFGLYFLYRIVSGSFSLTSGKPALDQIPEWVFSLYDFSHSLIVACIFILIAYRFKRELCFPMLAWPFHILLDFFTHSVEYFPTPVLWPVSSYRFDGVPWSDPRIFYTNIACIFLLFIYRRKTKNVI